MYQYKAKLIRVVDGDTVDAMIDCGFSTFKKERIRLYGIDTPECRTRDKEEKNMTHDENSTQDEKRHQ